MHKTIDKISVAVEQLDWAIRLFLDHRAYIPAITLAGASEEIIGRLTVQPIYEHLKTKVSQSTGVPEKTVSDRMNQTKNCLKHNSGRQNSTITLDLENEAILYIARVLDNFRKFRRCSFLRTGKV